MQRAIGLIALKLVLMLAGQHAATAEEVGLRAPEGFEVSLYAGDELAHNIYSMTIDAKGRVVVAGPGYVKILHDDDRDSKADRATLYSPIPKSGAQGMYFDGPDLICTGDNALMRLRDREGDGKADGKPETWARLSQGEHGAHAVRRGPDGWYYVMCGNGAGVSKKHIHSPRSPVRSPESGALLRFSPDGKTSEVIAHGFRNAYDFDFNTAGHMFTYDSDGERDHHLPWYAPTRVFDIAQGMHHGWLLPGWMRSWNRPASYFDNVERLAELGRGSPTGVQVYRHRQFPNKYRNGLFVACWSLGRIYFVPLEPQGATYKKTKPEIFLETTGTVGFAPVDLAVGSEGDLFVAIGGRGTRGSVFRVSYKQREKQEEPASDLERVLQANQPLSSWSRARWVPLAKKLGRDAFLTAAMHDNLDLGERTRAIEILVETFGGIKIEEAHAVVENGLLGILARLAWAIGRGPADFKSEAFLPNLTQFKQPLADRAAWEALATWPELIHVPTQVTEKAMSASTSRRVRAAAHRADRRHKEPIDMRSDEVVGFSRQALTQLWRIHFRGKLTTGHLVPTATAFRETDDNQLRLEAIRLMQIALADIHAAPATPEVYAGYQPNGKPDLKQKQLAACYEVASVFPTKHTELNRELARLCGMVRLNDPGLLSRIARMWTDNSSVGDDVHYLIVMSLLRGGRSEEVTRTTAHALCRLHHKMRAEKKYPSRNWPLRVGEMFVELCKKDRKLAEAVVADRSFGLAGHAMFAARMPSPVREAAVRKLLSRVRAAEDEVAWTGELVQLIGRLPADESLPALREPWENMAVRDAITRVLAKHRRPEDHRRLIEALGSARSDIVALAAKALAKMDRPAKPIDLLAAARALRRFCLDRRQAVVRRSLAELLRTWTGKEIRVEEQGKGDLLEQYEPWFEYLAKKYPDLRTKLAGGGLLDGADWIKRLEKIDWSSGDVKRGQDLFTKRSCASCHTGTSRLGPTLAGVGGRFARADLVTAIVDPDRDVSPTYQTTLIETASGKVYHGLLVYDSPEATLMQTAADTNIRIAGDQIVSARPSRRSLMPAGLLSEASDREIADLVAYLRTIK